MPDDLPDDWKKCEHELSLLIDEKIDVDAGWNALARQEGHAGTTTQCHDQEVPTTDATAGREGTATDEVDAALDALAFQLREIYRSPRVARCATYPIMDNIATAYEMVTDVNRSRHWQTVGCNEMLSSLTVAMNVLRETATDMFNRSRNARNRASGIEAVGEISIIADRIAQLEGVIRYSFDQPDLNSFSQYY
ncbi:hypothetical protein [Actinomadura rayongensis]|uniref:Uncharacterized protein n=1 Tax=Actinomadura rayongensis TaxID=1429076 RepID=A0A6I4W8G4_9ACTN|nr:hypothetical protein [Actinomadura rayongensis]MXQ67039.1 hypothetical protein [Actinomadura rayongensis]